MTNTERIIEELKALPEIELFEVMEEIEKHLQREKIKTIILHTNPQDVMEYNAAISLYYRSL